MLGKCSLHDQTCCNDSGDLWCVATKTCQLSGKAESDECCKEINSANVWCPNYTPLTERCQNPNTYPDK